MTKHHVEPEATIMRGYETRQWTYQPGGDGLQTVENWNNAADSLAPLQVWKPMNAIPYLEPALIGQTHSRGPFAPTGLPGLVGDFIPYPTASVVEYHAPRAPIRRDPYEQGYQLTSGQAVSGAAPTSGIYTGVEDMP